MNLVMIKAHLYRNEIKTYLKNIIEDLQRSHVWKI